MLKKYQEAFVNEGVPVIEKTLKEDVAPTLAKTADALTPVAEKAAPVLAKGITQTLKVFLDAAILPALKVLAAFIAQSGSQAAIAAQDLLAKYSAVAGTEVTKAVDMLARRSRRPTRRRSPRSPSRVVPPPRLSPRPSRPSRRRAPRRPLLSSSSSSSLCSKTC